MYEHLPIEDSATPILMPTWRSTFPAEKGEHQVLPKFVTFQL
jgi:hypothetical protein